MKERFGSRFRQSGDSCLPQPLRNSYVSVFGIALHYPILFSSISNRGGHLGDQVRAYEWFWDAIIGFVGNRWKLLY